MRALTTMAEENTAYRRYLRQNVSNLPVTADTLPLYAKGLDGVLGSLPERYNSVETTIMTLFELRSQ